MNKRNGMLIPVLFIAMFVLFGSVWSAGAQDLLQESKQERDARMEWWREARFGMFIHWGAYAIPAGTYQE